MANPKLIRTLDDLWGAWLDELGEEERREPVKYKLTEEERAGRYELASDLFDDLLGVSMVEGEPQEQVGEGKRVIEVPVFERDPVHGLGIRGYRKVITEARYVDRPWNGDKSRYTIEELRRAVPAAIRQWADAKSKQIGDGKPNKSFYHLPYKTPDGTINLRAVRNALARAPQVKGVPASVIAAAIEELRRVLAAGKKALSLESAAPEGDSLESADAAERWDELVDVIGEILG